ncbi:Methyltransferase type 11 [uncultured Caudovirales phage]|uniref:Methyltransferase type 11 n=1 Tax=uncultured Caudovirales phage TaxID=2100421 RepID=A0A6J5LJA6_9CAUD|nr:Methyltransferase type 11 [uncultured Caudovirales phage]
MTKLDIGCGKNKREGFIGVDQYAMDGVDIVMDVRQKWTFDSDSVEEAHCSHFLEHLSGPERVKFYNELFRVLKPGAKATIITPHWASNRAYGDPTHQWPPVAEMGFYYLKQEWRDTQAPHTDIKWNPDGYSCNFDATWGYSFTPDLGNRNQEYVQFALQNYKEAAQDMIATLIKPAPKPAD